MRAVDGTSFANIAATTAAFELKGGKYGISVTATFGGGSVVLLKLHSDGSTYQSVHTALTAAGYTTVDIPSGTYKVTIATATAVYVAIQRIPGE
jgi:hypothetical protein